MAVHYSDNPRSETRFSHGGLVFLYSANKKPIRASGRDLSLSGIGLEFPNRLTSYRLGAELKLEFAHPHHLQGLLINVVLKRVTTDNNGRDHCGFLIVADNKLLKRRLAELISTFVKVPKRF
jgi:hypothetical protein